MGQQMTPDTAKIKCKNFLATLLRLASDQPESVAKNVRALIQVSCIIHLLQKQLMNWTLNTKYPLFLNLLPM